MGQTLVEKIIAAHLVDDGNGRGVPAPVRPGDLVEVSVDVVMANDITAPLAIRAFEALTGSTPENGGRVFDPDRVLLVPSHFVPAKDIKSAEQIKTLRRFAQAQALTHRFMPGRAGIEHVILPDMGLVLPGDLVIGGDSHTCTYGAVGALATGMGSTDIGVAMATGRTWLRVPETIRFVYEGTLRPWVGGKDLILYTIGQIGVGGARYKAMEFTGPAIAQLDMANRFTMVNMVIEAGGKCGFIPVDETTLAYVEARATHPYTVYRADEDAHYAAVYRWDVSDLEPQVALPYSPGNVLPISQVGTVKPDQVFIGSCTNGRLEDLAQVMAVLERAGRAFHPDLQVVVIPGSQAIYLEALRRGWIERLAEAGATITAGTCGPCLGGYFGILGAGQVGVSTSNRNFRGRMGHREAQVYLVNPAVAAATAILGRLAHPDEV